MQLPKKDSATGRGIRTTAQGFISAAVLLGGALVAAINGVPGCGEAIVKVVQDNFLLIASTFGVSTGLVSFLWNVFLRKDVRNY